MRALTLHQPWASLAALGIKDVETRSWGTEHRGPMIIHAAKQTKAQVEATIAVPYWPLLREAGIDRLADVPFGAILAVRTVIDVREITEELAEATALFNPQEFALGDWTPGRFAWYLSQPETDPAYRVIDPPLPIKGAQRLWSCDLPEEG